MRGKDGRFLKGFHYSKETQFKKGQHWRKHQPFWDKEWLEEEYVEKGRSTGEIGKEFGVTMGAILFWLNKYGIKRRNTSESRKVKYWGSSGENNPMWGIKGEKNHAWKGGSTPERQLFYESAEWKKACSAVWKRDNATCQRCMLKKGVNPDMQFHIHHIISFAHKAYRTDVDNLVLLCKSCHNWVHSKRNKNRELIRRV